MGPKHIVFKKLSQDKSVGVYMERRDFVDHINCVDPVDGVILVDPVQMKGKKAFVTLSCTFRYGAEDEEVMGIKFRRDLYTCTRQMYPPLQDKDKSTHTRVQNRLLCKLGENAYPFFFEFPDNLPCSVGLQPAPTDVGKHCAVEFEVKAFSTKTQGENVRKRSTVRLMIRKVQFAPEQSGPAPSVQTTYEFAISDQSLLLEASLGKLTYYHGENITIHLNITNDSSRTVKSICFLVEQVANVVLYSNDSYVKTVAKEQTSDTVASGASLEKVYTILPLLANNSEKRGIALDGKLKYEDTNLASSSIVKEGVLKEVLGILVCYRVVVKLKASGVIASSEVRAELPFQLMHPKPDAETEHSEETVLEEFKNCSTKGAKDQEDKEEEEGGNASPAEG